MPEGYETSHIQPYRSMYVDMKRPEIATIKRDRYDASKAEYDALNRAIGSIQTIGEDPYTVNALKQRVEDRMSAVVNSGAFENGNMAVSDAVTDFASDTRVAKAAESAENYKKSEALKAQAIAQGKQIYDFDRQFKGYDPEGKPIFQHKSETHNTERDGVYQPAYEEKLDNVARVKQLMDGIADDPISLKAVAAVGGLTEEQAYAYLKYGQQISDDKVERIAEALTPLYADSQEGKQKFRALTQLELKDEKTAMEVLKNDLYAFGKKQVGGQLHYIQNPYGQPGEQQEAEAVFTPETIQSLTLNPSKEPLAVWGNPVAKEKLFDVKGNLRSSFTIGDAEGPNVELNKKGVPITGSNERTASTELIRFKKQLEKAGGDVSKVKNVSGRLLYFKEKYAHLRAPGESDSAFLEKMDKAYNDNVAQTTAVYEFSPEGRQKAAVMLGDKFSSLQIYDPKVGELPMSVNQWSSKGEDEWLTFSDSNFAESFKKALQAGGAVTEDNSFVEVKGMVISGELPGGTEVRFSHNGTPYDLVIKASDQTERNFNTINKMSNMLRTLDTESELEVSVPPAHKNAGIESRVLKLEFVRDGKEIVPVFMQQYKLKSGRLTEKQAVPANIISEMAKGLVTDYTNSTISSQSLSPKAAIGSTFYGSK